MVDIFAVFSAIGAGIETARKGLEFFKDAKAVKDDKAVQEKANEVRATLIDLKDQYLTLKEAMQAIQEENLELKKQAAERSQWGETRKLLAVKDGAYYLSQKIDGYDEGPYCIRCADKDGVLIHAVPAPHMLRRMTGNPFSCTECDRHTSRTR